MEVIPPIDLLVTASCEHCSDEGAAVAANVEGYGLCAECKARMDAYGLLVPVTEADKRAPTTMDDLHKALDEFQRTIDRHFPDQSRPPAEVT